MVAELKKTFKEKYLKKEVLLTNLVVALVIWLASNGWQTLKAVEAYPEMKDCVNKLEDTVAKNSIRISVLESKLDDIDTNTKKMLDIMLKKSQ
jgi:MarR-like DNA-binding transcriptional regulator SgrR of sgrS sRNA